MAAHMAWKNIAIPAFDLCDALLPHGWRAIFHEDNQAMIRVVETGRNPTMRHIGRVYRIAISWLHERLAAKGIKDPVDLVYTKSDDMAADIYTKAFTDPKKWDHALQLIVIFVPQRQQEIEIARLKRLRAE